MMTNANSENGLHRGETVPAMSTAWRTAAAREPLLPRQVSPPASCALRFSEPFGHTSRRVSGVAAVVIAALLLSWLAQMLEWRGRAPIELPLNRTLYYTFAPNDSSLASWLNCFALALFVCAGLLKVLQSERPRLPIVISILMVGMLCYGFIWVLLGLDPSEYTYVLGSNGPLTFLMCLGIYAAFDATLWRALRWLSFLIAYWAAALGGYYSLQLSLKGNFIGATPMNQHFQVAFWLGLCALLLAGSSGWKSRLAAIIPVALCVPMGILMASRSFALLATIAIVLGFINVFQSPLKQSLVKAVILGLFCLALVAAGVWLLSLVAPARVEALQGRLLEDTRSSQYSEFFNQVPVTGLITGLGPKATYTYDNDPNYSYIDNQFLFILFKFGLPVLIGYCAVVIYPGLCLCLTAANRQERLLGLFFVLWVLAALGVSIYHNIHNNLPNLIAVLLAGRCFSLLALKQRRPLAVHGQRKFVWI